MSDVLSFFVFTFSLLSSERPGRGRKSRTNQLNLGRGNYQKAERSFGGPVNSDMRIDALPNPALGGKSQGVRVSGEEFVREDLANSNRFNSAHGALRRSGCARKHCKAPLGGFDLFALAAGEFHPLDQSSATEIGIYMGNPPVACQVSLRF